MHDAVNTVNKRNNLYDLYSNRRFKVTDLVGAHLGSAHDAVNTVNPQEMLWCMADGAEMRLEADKGPFTLYICVCICERLPWCLLPLKVDHSSLPKVNRIE